MLADTIQIVLIRSGGLLTVDSPENLLKNLKEEILETSIYSVYVGRKNYLTVALDI